MIKEIRLKNFKAFGKEQTFELAPLTLLFGRNSVGKSTMVQAMQLLTQSIRHQNWRIHPSLEGRPKLELQPYVDGGEVDLGDAMSCLHKSAAETGKDPKPATITFQMEGLENPTIMREKWSKIAPVLFEMSLGERHKLVMTQGGVGDRPGEGPTLRITKSDSEDAFREGRIDLPDIEWRLGLGAKGSTSDTVNSGGVVWSSSRKAGLDAAANRVLDSHFFDAIHADLDYSEIHPWMWTQILGAISWFLAKDRKRWDDDCFPLFGARGEVVLDNTTIPLFYAMSGGTGEEQAGIFGRERIREWRPQAAYYWLLAVTGVASDWEVSDMYQRADDLCTSHIAPVLSWLADAVKHENINSYVDDLRKLLDQNSLEDIENFDLYEPILERLKRHEDIAAAGFAFARLVIERGIAYSGERVIRDGRIPRRLGEIEYVKAVRDEFPRFMRSSQMASSADSKARPVGTRSFSSRRGGSDYRFGELGDLGRVNEVLRSLSIPYELDQRVLASGHFWELVVREQSGDGHREMNLADVGFGIGQLVPLAMALVARTPCTVIEEPEAHLHPGLQSKLGDLFIESVAPEKKRRKSPAKQIIAETHSEHLVLRILRRIREGRISPDQVSILYVDRVDGESTVKRLHIDEEGEFIDKWPHGFFEDRWEDLE
ncbi:DUF3696 domain-containing protein [bacterium]|nr:DUF3696 domain-containing protein [bacterium]